MQVTICLSDADEYLRRLVDKHSLMERTSRSAVILSILEEHFEKTNHIGEIVVDMGVLSDADVTEALECQANSFPSRLLGEVHISEYGVDEEAIERALVTQSRFSGQKVEF
ncbi:hypothetical protein ACFLR0_00065 [Candidatus Bipolaricaulota bacterium]